MKLGLDNIRELLVRLGDPQKKFPSIHIAGTNGKGSVSAMLSAAFQVHGYKTGLYTSPHLLDFRERIKMNGELVPKAFVADFLSRIWTSVEELNATFFEVTTALAFDYFASENVDIAVIETGLGGRLDATNALEHPLATVVTSISLEHTQFLGDTLELIAAEKAGILKKDSPAIVNVDVALREIFIAKAKDVGTTVLFTDEFVIPLEYAALHSPLLGKHQERNLRTALATLSQIPITVDGKKVQSGIEDTITLTGLRARLEEYPDVRFTEKRVKLLLDVAHNPDAFSVLAEYFQGINVQPVVILGVAKDKDVGSILNEAKKFALRLVAVEADTHRALPSSELAKQAAKMGIAAINGGGVKEGVQKALETLQPGETVLLTGSHYVVGEYLSQNL